MATTRKGPGRPAEDPDRPATVTVSFVADAALVEALRARARDRGVTISTMVRLMLHEATR